MRRLSAPMASIALVLVAAGLITTGVGLHAASLSGPLTTLVLAGYFAGMVIAALRAPVLISRVGLAMSLVGGIVASVVGTVLLASTDAPLTWTLARTLQGAAIGVLFVAVECWINLGSTDRTRPVALGVYMAVNQLSLALGQFLVPALGERWQALCWAGAAGFAVALVPVLIARRDAPVVPARSRETPVGSSTIGVGIVGAFASGIFTATALSVAPVFTASLGLSAGQTAAFIAALLIGGVTLQLPAGRMAVRHGADMVLQLTCMGVMALAMVLLLAPGAGSFLLISAAVSIGAVGFLLYPLAQAAANTRIADHERAGAGGALILAYAIGGVAGPLLYGLFEGALGPSAFTATLVVAGALPLVVVGPLPRRARAGLAAVRVRR